MTAGCRLARWASGPLIALLLLSGFSRASADTPPAPAAASETKAGGADNESRLRQLEEKVRQLTAELEALRKSAAGPDSARLAELERQVDVLTQEIEHLRLGEAANPPDLKSRYGFGPAASKIYQVRQGVSLGGYGEFTYQNFTPQADDGTPSDATDRLDLTRAVLYFGYKWNDRILMNSEIEFEHATTGEGDEEKGEVSVEFAYLDFLMRKGMNARAGLILVPVGFINEMHEPTTFYGVLRPEVEQLILPTTWREGGAGVFGEAGKFVYRVYLMAGLNALGISADEGLHEARQQGSNSLAKDFALAGRLDLDGIPGLLAGVSLFTGDSGQGQVGANARVTLGDAHVQYEWRGLQVRGLWARGSIGDAAAIDAAQAIPTGSDESVGEHFGGWYAQAAWDFFSVKDGADQSLVGFLRYESLDTQDGVPAGFLENPALNQSLWTIGASWKPISHVVFKVDFQDRKNDAGTGVDQFNAGLGWIF